MKPREVSIQFIGPRTRGIWSARMAYRATLTSVLAIVAAYVVRTVALPTLDREQVEAAKHLSFILRIFSGLRGWVMFLPIPGLALGIAAIILRPMRPLLAPLAMLAAALAVAMIIGVLVAGLAPMYQVAADMQLGR